MRLNVMWPSLSKGVAGVSKSNAEGFLSNAYSSNPELPREASSSFRDFHPQEVFFPSDFCRKNFSCYPARSKRLC